MELDGKVALVTGASGGIGAAVARKLRSGSSRGAGMTWACDAPSV
jgi:NAD(P)-dependent dehydrogenase (short-subunit alcohol dehydrogenase family)